jgi:hypothetical protein
MDSLAVNSTDGHINVLVSILTTLAALWGAVLSTYLLRVQLVENRRSLKVTLTGGAFTSGSSTSNLFLFTNVGNTGKRPIKIDSANLQLPNGRSIITLQNDTNVTLPHLLTDGEGCRFWASYSALIDALREYGISEKTKIRAQVHDEAGGVYVSKWLKITLDEKVKPPSSRWLWLIRWVWK